MSAKGSQHHPRDKSLATILTCLRSRSGHPSRGSSSCQYTSASASSNDWRNLDETSTGSHPTTIQNALRNITRPMSVALSGDFNRHHTAWGSNKTHIRFAEQTDKQSNSSKHMGFTGVSHEERRPSGRSATRKELRQSTRQ